METGLLFALWHEQGINNPELEPMWKKEACRNDPGGVQKGAEDWKWGTGFSPIQSHLWICSQSWKPWPYLNGGLRYTVPGTGWVGKNLIVGALTNREEFSLYMLKARSCWNFIEKRKTTGWTKLNSSRSIWQTFRQLIAEWGGRTGTVTSLGKSQKGAGYLEMGLNRQRKGDCEGNKQRLKYVSKEEGTAFSNSSQTKERVE